MAQRDTPGERKIVIFLPIVSFYVMQAGMSSS